jgi:hypothetical protein
MTKARDTANLTGSGVGLSLLDIDAGTDIGAALVDADLMIVDDGAGGTNRKATMSRLATYMGTKIGGGMEFIASSGAISNAASASFTGFDASKYDHYRFYFMYVKPVANSDPKIGAYVSTDGGTNYDTTASNYIFDGTTTVARGFALQESSTTGHDTNEYGVCGYLDVFGPHLTNYTYAISETLSMSGNGSAQPGNTAGRRHTIHKVAADVDAIQFIFNDGNIASGEITMFGVVNS